jgi:putative transmembrane protein
MANVALLFLLVLGIIGLFYKILEGVNYIVVGIIMIWICSKSRNSGGGGEYMYIRGWIGAITSLIYGILKILDMI